MKKGKKMSAARKKALSIKMKAIHAARKRSPVVDHPTPTALMSAEGYDALAAELAAAFAQSAHGKGRERHNPNHTPFDRQPIMELGRLYGPGFTAGQAAKKTQEALKMLAKGPENRERAMFEVHGAIVYLSATASLIREGK